MAIYNTQKEQIGAAYSSEKTAISVAYDSEKNIVFSSGDEPTGRPNYNSFSVSPALAINGGQGFDVYNGYLFMVAGNGTTQVVDMETGETLTTVSITVGHGNSVSFSDEFYSPGDEFPLLYISKDQGDPCDVYIYRVTRNENNVFSFDLVKTIRFSLDQVGYYANAAFDTENRVLYMLAYTENAFTQVSEMQITAWDMTTLTENEDGTFTPEYISKITLDYAIWMRAGQQFKDGMIWTGSGYDGYVYAIDPATGEKIHTYTRFAAGEYEGEAFINDFKMMVGYNNTSLEYGFLYVDFAKIYD